MGLLQGENLSPIMFSMFLNDLKNVLCNPGAKMSTLQQAAQAAQLENIDDFMYIFLLLYADDTAILAETPSALQNAFT